MDLAKVFVRTVVRAFYTTEYILVIDALTLHSTLPDKDLAHVLGMQPKHVRRLLGMLHEHGLVNKQTRGERRDGAPKYYTNNKDSSQPPRERLANVEWYYINFHRAIDNIKWRLWKLRAHIEKQGAPTTEKKDLHCPRCKNQYTELEVLDHLDPSGNFLCHRCNHILDLTDDSTSGPAENQEMKRLNTQLADIIVLMQKIDATTVPENDFDTALRYALPVKRSAQDPGTRGEAVDLPKPLLMSSKGMAMLPEKVEVDIAEDIAAGEPGSRESREMLELAARREGEAKQNALPDWITRSTLTGNITTVGAKEAAARAEREQHLGASSGLGTGNSDANGGAGEQDAAAETKSAIDDKSAIDQYYEQLAAEQKREEQDAADDDDDEDDEDDDGFEDVHVPLSRPDPVPAAKAIDTSGAVSSNVSDDERDAKRVKIEPGTTDPANGSKEETSNGQTVPTIIAPSGADAVDSDEDDFEDV